MMITGIKLFDKKDRSPVQLEKNSREMICIQDSG